MGAAARKPRNFTRFSAKVKDHAARGALDTSRPSRAWRPGTVGIRYTATPDLTLVSKYFLSYCFFVAFICVLLGCGQRAVVETFN
jgi:hypothetical protein